MELGVLVYDRADPRNHGGTVMNPQPIAEVRAGVIRAAAMICPKHTRLYRAGQLIHDLTEFVAKARLKYPLPFGTIVPAEIALLPRLKSSDPAPPETLREPRSDRWRPAVGAAPYPTSFTPDTIVTLGQSPRWSEKSLDCDGELSARASSA
jgi:hypothetical protein